MIIALQIGNIDNISKIINQVKKYDCSGNLFLVSVLEDISLNVQISFNSETIITYHENRGMDIGPFLLQCKWIIDNVHNYDTYDYIYKIHTKSNDRWFQELNTFDCCSDNIKCSEFWLKSIDHVNKETTIDICNQFAIENIYYDDLKYIDYDEEQIDVLFYENYYNVYTTYNDQINKQFLQAHAKLNKHALCESDIICKNRHQCKFVAGTIFQINTNLLLSFLKNIDLIKLYSILEVGYVVNEIPTYVHALERIISGFFY